MITGCQGGLSSLTTVLSAAAAATWPPAIHKQLSSLFRPFITHIRPSTWLVSPWLPGILLLLLPQCSVVSRTSAVLLLPARVPRDDRLLQGQQRRRKKKESGESIMNWNDWLHCSAPLLLLYHHRGGDSIIPDESLSCCSCLSLSLSINIQRAGKSARFQDLGRTIIAWQTGDSRAVDKRAKTTTETGGQRRL